MPNIFHDSANCSGERHSNTALFRPTALASGMGVQQQTLLSQASNVYCGLARLIDHVLHMVVFYESDLLEDLPEGVLTPVQPFRIQ
jgi:hypothetical protein